MLIVELLEENVRQDYQINEQYKNWLLLCNRYVNYDLFEIHLRVIFWKRKENWIFKRIFNSQCLYAEIDNMCRYLLILDLILPVMNDFFGFRIYLTISYSVLRNTAKLLLTHCFTSLQRFHLIRFTFGIYVTFIFDGSCRLPHAAPYRKALMWFHGISLSLIQRKIIGYGHWDFIVGGRKFDCFGHAIIELANNAWVNNFMRLKVIN